VPAGPASPQGFNAATVTPNRHTLLMNPGDSVTIFEPEYNTAQRGNQYAQYFIQTDLALSESTCQPDGTAARSRLRTLRVTSIRTGRGLGRVSACCGAPGGLT
jgi:hypothetical protein